MQKLQKLGWTDGRNVHIEVRLTGTDAERIQKFAKELVAWQPDVITTNSTPGTTAVQRETRTIPVVFAIVSDPIVSSSPAPLSMPPTAYITANLFFEEEAEKSSSSFSSSFISLDLM
ncbi:MAG: ABC transporter substrate binding protein [Bacteroidia bacterium]